MVPGLVVQESGSNRWWWFGHGSGFYWWLVCLGCSGPFSWFSEKGKKLGFGDGMMKVGRMCGCW